MWFYLSQQILDIFETLTLKINGPVWLNKVF